MIQLYPAERIYEEVAFIGYYLHWGQEEIIKMSHMERIRWCKEISKINRKLNEEKENIFEI